MEYNGKLYGHFRGNIYFDTGKTSKDWDKLEQSNKEANEFIKDIAKLLGMDADGLGYDELQYSIDDFETAIRALAKPQLNESVLPISGVVKSLPPEFDKGLGDDDYDIDQAFAFMNE